MSEPHRKLDYQTRGERNVQHLWASHIRPYRDTTEAGYRATRDGRIQGDSASLWLRANDPSFKPRKRSA